MSKKSYSDYPDRFFEVLEHFKSSDHPLHHPMIYREAISTRHSFYRFLAAIRQAADDGDGYAKQLREIAKKLSVAVTPAHAEPETSTDLCVYVNPLEVGNVTVVREETPIEVGDATPLDVDEIEQAIADKRRE